MMTKEGPTKIVIGPGGLEVERSPRMWEIGVRSSSGKRGANGVSVTSPRR